MSVIKFISSLFSYKKASNEGSVNTAVRSSKSTQSAATTGDNTSLPRRSVYEAPPPKTRRGLLVKEFDPVRIGTPVEGVTVTMKASMQISGVIEPTDDEVEECFAQIACFVDKDDRNAFVQDATENGASPFDSLVTEDDSFVQSVRSSPLGSDHFIKILRAKIRILIKEKKDIDIYLNTLLRAVYLNDISEEMGLNGTYKESKFRIIDARNLLTAKTIKALRHLPLNYKILGYELFPSFIKTDIKWITKRYGEPMLHTSPASQIRIIKRNAIITHYEKNCDKNPGDYKSKSPVEDLLIYSLKRDVRMFLGYHKSWYERVRGRASHGIATQQYVEDALKVTRGQFVVADLETTGLDAEVDDILEFGALICDPSGTEISRFEVLVNPNIDIPVGITELTGISNGLVKQRGKLLEVAFSEFVSFVGYRPIFFHNSNFDSSFLRVASDRVSVSLDNPIFDTLTLSRYAWRGLSSYSLSSLSKEFGIEPPTHRAINDALAAHKVLLKIREKCSQEYGTTLS